MTINAPPPNCLQINLGNDGWVIFHPDGAFTFHGDYTPNDTAKTFWEAIAGRFPRHLASVAGDSFMARNADLLERLSDQPSEPTSPSDTTRLDWLSTNRNLEEVHKRWCRNEPPFDIRGAVDAVMALQAQGESP